MQNSVLIVDDEDSTITLLEALLRPDGYNLIVLRNGEKALAYLADNVPDLVLLDIMMPGISGFAVLTEIRKNIKTKTVPVIFLTSLTDREDRIKGLDVGADDFISKPFDKAELVFKVRTQVNLSVLRRQINEKEKLANVMDLLFEGIVLTDCDFNIQQINKTAMEMLRLKEQTGNLENIFEKKYGYIIEVNSEKGHFILSRQESPDDPQFFLSVEYRRVAQLSADKCSYVFAFKDVTEAHARDKMKLDFLSLISNKIRIPVTVINGYSTMLNVFETDDKLKEIVTSIMRNSEVIENLIKRVMFFVEIENTPLTGYENTSDVKEMVDRFSLVYKKQCELITDENQIKMNYWQAIAAEELIGNAVKFNDKEKTVIRLQVDSEGMTVEDNGPGIPIQEREKVFEPFYQINRKISGNNLGVGIGLSVVKRMAETTNHSVVLESSESGGLKVIISKK